MKAFMGRTNASGAYIAGSEEHLVAARSGHEGTEETAKTLTTRIR